jgi:hypothetical protein
MAVPAKRATPKPQAKSGSAKDAGTAKPRRGNTLPDVEAAVAELSAKSFDPVPEAVIEAARRAFRTAKASRND